MLTVPSTEIAKRFSRYRSAAQYEPVGVTHHGRITEVLVSKRDHDDYLRLKALATRAIATIDLSDEAVEALVSSTMDGRHDHLNALMEI